MKAYKDDGGSVVHMVHPNGGNGAQPLASYYRDICDVEEINGVKLTVYEKQLLTQFHRHENEKGLIFLGIEKICRKLPCDKRTARKTLQSLREKGAITLTGKHGAGRNDEYRLNSLLPQATPTTPTTTEEVDEPPPDNHNGHHAPYERGLPPVTPGPRTDGWTPPNISYTELTRRVDRPGPGQDMYRAYSAFVAIKRGEGLTDMRQIAQLWREQNRSVEM